MQDESSDGHAAEDKSTKVDKHSEIVNNQNDEGSGGVENECSDIENHVDNAVHVDDPVQLTSSNRNYTRKYTRYREYTSQPFR